MDKVTVSMGWRAALSKEVDGNGAAVLHCGWRRMWTMEGVDGGGSRWQQESWGGAGGMWWGGTGGDGGTMERVAAIRF